MIGGGRSLRGCTRMHGNMEIFMDSIQNSLIPLTSSAEGSRVSRGPAPGGRRAAAMTVTSGRRCAESSRRVVRDGCLAKMCRALMTSDSWRSTECFLTWKVSGTKRSRLKFRLVPSMPRTSGPGSSLWPTPVANDDNKTPEAHMAMKRRMKGGPRSTITSLQVMAKAVKMWSTPQNHDRSKGDPRRWRKDGSAHGAANLNDGVAMVVMWPTPASRDFRYPNSPESQSKRNEGCARGQQLPNEVAHSVLGTTLSGSSGQMEKPGALNPEFVCWLMGYPTEVLGSARLGTP